ncbi:MAG: SCO family protein [Croceitalea sp.]|nr:SCO family protein [Croceitalea sp.]MBT8237168.1 SCO family protein [Croceitalea sp.]NNC34661.1 SCO family protein [Croceitalea sp.]NNL09181.1 SCO family protein [Croceitalea sp.]NNM17163.1 SCO family protein [Croceitalea sp.]
MPTGANKKQKYTYVWVSAIILIFGTFAVYEITKRLKEGTVVDNDRMAGNATVAPLTHVIANGKKRSVPPFSFIDQDSVLITDEDLLGKVYVVDFFFTTCPTICPIMTKNLKELQNTFGKNDDFALASFTINPRYDTPSRLKTYANSYGANENWHFLTGDQDKIYQLAREGFYILANEVEDAPGGFEHSGMFALIDKKGYIRSRMDQNGNPLIYYRGTITEAQGVNEEGEAQQITMLKEDIKKLLKE